MVCVILNKVACDVFGNAVTDKIKDWFEQWLNRAGFPNIAAWELVKSQKSSIKNRDKLRIIYLPSARCSIPRFLNITLLMMVRKVQKLVRLEGYGNGLKKVCTTVIRLLQGRLNCCTLSVWVGGGGGRALYQHCVNSLSTVLHAWFKCCSIVINGRSRDWTLKLTDTLHRAL